MPSSDPETIPVVIGLIRKLKPKSVLDLGAGYGKYGALFREYLGLRHVDREKNRNGIYTALKDNGILRIDAVEGYSPYIGELHRIVYDNIYIENIADFCKKSWKSRYDLIFMGDVLEHFDKLEGLDILKILMKRATIGLLISMPFHMSAQGPVFGNELERHHCYWRVKEFRSLAPFVHCGRKGHHLIAFLTNQRKYYEIARGKILRRKLRVLRNAVTDSW